MSLLGGLIGSAVKPVVDGVTTVVSAKEKTKQVADLAMAWAQVASAAWRPWLARLVGWSLLAYVVGTFIMTIWAFIAIRNGETWADMSSEDSALYYLWQNWKALGSDLWGFAALFLTTYAGSRGLEKVAESIGGRAGAIVGSAARAITGGQKPPQPTQIVNIEGVAPETVQKMDGIVLPNSEPNQVNHRVEARTHLPFDTNQYAKEVMREEGRVYSIYPDSLGNRTAGIGHLLVPEDPEYNWPMKSPVSRERVNEWFRQDLIKGLKDARAAVKDFDNLPHEARLVLANMAFQLGAAGLRNFTKTLGYIDKREWVKAADEALDSRWAKQTPARATRMSDRLRAIEPTLVLA